MHRTLLFASALLLVSSFARAQQSCAGKLRISTITTLKAAGYTGPARYTFLVTNDSSDRVTGRVVFKNLPADVTPDFSEAVVLVEAHKTIARQIFFGTAKSVSTYPTLSLANVRVTVDRAPAAGTYGTIYDCTVHK